MLILEGPNHPVQALTFSPDSTTLYIVQGHHGIRAWNVTNRTATRVEYEGKLLVRQFLFHPGGRWAFSATAHTTPTDPSFWRIIDLSTGTMRPFNCSAHARDGIAFFADGSRFVSFADGGHAVRGWVMEESGPREMWHYDIADEGNALYVAALDNEFASAEIVRHTRLGWRPRIVIHRASDGAPVTELSLPHGEIQQLLASPDGAFLVARCETELWVWGSGNWSAPPLVIASTGHDNEYDEYHVSAMEPAAVCFHPSGRYLLRANGDSTVTAFDTATWQPVQTWTWGAGELRAVGISSDGTLAAAGSARGEVVVWDWDL